MAINKINSHLPPPPNQSFSYALLLFKNINVFLFSEITPENDTKNHPKEETACFMPKRDSGKTLGGESILKFDQLCDENKGNPTSHKKVCFLQAEFTSPDNILKINSKLVWHPEKPATSHLCI